MSVTDAADPTVDADEQSGDALDDLPPSAKLVLKVLEYNDELTQHQLVEQTRLPARTVRHAVSRLEDVGVVDTRFSFTDARKRLYSLALE
jgi:DNA-binding MarR family transcriptional regulator